MFVQTFNDSQMGNIAAYTTIVPIIIAAVMILAIVMMLSGGSQSYSYEEEEEIPEKPTYDQFVKSRDRDFIEYCKKRDEDLKRFEA